MSKYNLSQLAVIISRCENSSTAAHKFYGIHLQPDWGMHQETNIKLMSWPSGSISTCI